MNTSTKKRAPRSKSRHKRKEKKKNGRRCKRGNETSEEDSNSSSESSSSSESDEEQEKTVKVYRTKHLLKPPKFDGVMYFETFWAEFKKCAKHNCWNRKQVLVYLRNSLDKEAANVLWDYGKEVTES